LQIVALRALKREAAMRQPFNHHRQVSPIRAEGIFCQISFQPQRIEKLLDSCKVLVHIGSCACLISTIMPESDAFLVH